MSRRLQETDEVSRSNGHTLGIQLSFQEDLQEHVLFLLEHAFYFLQLSEDVSPLFREAFFVS